MQFKGIEKLKSIGYRSSLSFIDSLGWIPVAIALVPTFLGFAAYNYIGILITRSRPAVIGTITDVVRNQGRHHINYASIEFPLSKENQTVCHVRTWFRGADAGIYEGAQISVVPALSRCGTPWFPEHIPPPSEGFMLAAVAAAIAVGLFFYRLVKAGSSKRA